MNRIFNFNRFGKYFLYDLRNAGNRFWISLLVAALMPVIAFVVAEIFSLTINGHFASVPEMCRYFAAFIGIEIVLLAGPARIYGGITDKRSGSDYLLLPASVFEKWLSMMAVCLLALPALLLAIMLAGDALMTLCFGGHYAGSYLAADISRSFSLDAGEVSFNLFAVGYLNWVGNILVFTLGAVCFRKSKIAKTLLAILLVSIVLSTVLAVAGGQAFFSQDSIFDVDDPYGAASKLNLVFNVTYIALIAVMAAAIYLRLKTIKH